MKLTCKICSACFDTAVAFERHFSITHSVSPASRFTCGIESCFLQFSALNRFERHLAEFHIQSDAGFAPILQENVPEDMSLQCLHCNHQFKCKTTLRVHRKRKHSSERNKHLQQGWNAGGNSEMLSVDHNPLNLNYANDFPPQNSCSSPVAHSSRDLEMVSTISSNSTSEEISKKYLHLYLTLRTKYHVPESTIQHIIDTEFALNRESSVLMRNKLFEELTFHGFNDEKLKEIVSNSVEQSNVPLEVHGPDGPLRSMYMREQNYVKNFRFVKPSSHKLGLNDENEKRKYHTVSIKESIAALFEDDSVYEQYLDYRQRPRSSEDGMIRDIHDGTLCREHTLLSKDPSAIGLIFYQDDLELVNPLGSAKCTHKITVVEFTLNFLKPWSRLKKDIIQLALIAAEKDVAYFGLPEVLELLIKELKELETDGMNIRGEMVKVIPLMLLGDNLGTHTFTGYLENFSKAKYFCRYCEESRPEWHRRWMGRNVPYTEDDSESDDESCIETDDSDSDSDNEIESNAGELLEENVQTVTVPSTLKEAPFSEAPLRTPDAYDKCLERLEKCRSLDQVKGIVAKCQFNDLESFHCVGASPPCIAHDLFEGVIAHDVMLGLKYFSKKFSISPEYISRRVKSLKMLGSDLGDKPVKITEKSKKLKGSAIQNWNFLRFLPLIIGSRITDKSDPVWQMMLLLIELTRILTSPVISENSLPFLKQKIHLYLTMRSTYFPDVPLRPKHHYLEHYVELIRRFGCLMRVSTLSFESKHRFFKSTAQAKKNFKNVTKTLSNEHQLHQSSVSVASMTCNYPEVVDAEPFNDICVDPHLKESATLYFGAESVQSLACSEKVRLHGTLYSKGDAVVTCSNDNARVEMCLIEKLLIRGRSCYAAGFRCVAELNPNWQIYKLQRTCQYTIVNLERLPDYVAYPLYKEDGEESEDVILLKHITFSPTMPL